ncbi:hypothetical protein KVR01_008397 [Diaporthe batatas]|uniref:uncharacterized protein n=1 Tax=Diaporthe batatas TaxID=748121 RepID=UPI001D0490D5|nr:uncharacterized protein KVR01_008397 [Diaporthe batatas]KAG8161410.1 hypothetical protein KVR01_008397 [Diaporthe batatas]
MVHPQPQLLTRSDLRRINDCLAENTALADCWKNDKIVIVACEPTGAHLHETSLLSLDILSPTSNPIWGSEPSEKHPTRQLCHRHIVALDVPKETKGLPWHGPYNCRQQFRDRRDGANARAQGVFAELRGQYASVCLVSHDLRDSLCALATFGVALPPGTVHVDLVKVLEHQSQLSGGGGPPEGLGRYVAGENVVVRKGRYSRRPWPLVGWWGTPNFNLPLLEVLGPAAEAHRRDKTEKRDTAMKRIVRRMAVGDIPVRKKGWS